MTYPLPNYHVPYISDSPDVDLDALLEDLCSMEKDIMSIDKPGANDSGISSNSSTTLSSTGTTYSDSLSFSSHGSTKPMSPRSPRSPVPANVSIFVIVTYRKYISDPYNNTLHTRVLIIPT